MDIANILKQCKENPQSLSDTISASGVDINDILKQCRQNPKALLDTITGAGIDNDMIEKILDMMGENGKVLRSEMRNLNITSDNIMEHMNKTLKTHQKIPNKLPSKMSKNLQPKIPVSDKKDTKILFLTKTRVAKVKTLPSFQIKKYIFKLIRCENPLQEKLPRFCDADLTVWYDPQNRSKNKRASKLLGKFVGGEIVITSSDPSIFTLSFLTDLEKKLPELRSTASESTPSEPTLSESTRSESTLSEPTVSEPTPSEPTVSESTPSEPIPSESTPSESTPSEPTLSE